MQSKGVDYLADQQQHIASHIKSKIKRLKIKDIITDQEKGEPDVIHLNPRSEPDSLTEFDERFQEGSTLTEKQLGMC